MDIEGKIGEALKNLRSEDDRTRTEARESLLEASLTRHGISALYKYYKTLDRLTGPGDRQLACVCRSRIHCFFLTAGKQFEWDAASLRELGLRIYKSWERGSKAMMLTAVLFFARVQDQGQDKVRLLEESGWLKIALCTDLHEHAILLLDALQDDERVLGAVIKSEDSAGMLVDGIGTLKEPERLDAIRVAGHALMKGLSGATQQEKWRWLDALHRKGIVKALLSCIDERFTEPFQYNALRFLAELAKTDDKFLHKMAEAEAVQVLATKALANRDSDSILVLVRQLLESGNSATALANFVASVIEVSLAALDKADPAEAKGILASLKTWCEHKPVPPALCSLDLDFSRLVRFLRVQDPEVVRPTLFVVSWALSMQTRDRSAALVMSLKEHDAVPTLLPFLATEELDALVSAIWRLGTPGPHEGTLWDERCTAVFLNSGCVLQILEELRDGSHEKVDTLANLFISLADISQEIADEFLIKGAFGILSNHLVTNKHLHATHEDHIVQAMMGILRNADRKYVSRYCVAADKDFPKVRRLLKVLQSSPGLSRWQVFRVIANIFAAFPGALGATLEAECVQYALRVLGCNPHYDAAKLSLDALGSLLLRAKASLGQTFIKAKGLELLHDHATMGPCRNSALMAVWFILNNAALAEVADRLAALAGSRNLAGLFEAYPPLVNDAEEWMEWHDIFTVAFRCEPNWSASGCPC